MKRPLRLAFALPLTVTSSLAFGFGDVGHMTVCEMAFNLSTKTTQAEILKITGGVPFNQQCAWPDQVKKVKPWNNTAGYHFINYNDGEVWSPSDALVRRDRTTGIETRQNVPGIGDMVQMAVRSQDKLKTLNTATERKQKLCYLRFMGHLAGDTHQPLHAGRSKDFGGNAVKVTFNNFQFYPIRSLMMKLQRDEKGEVIQDQCGKSLYEPPAQCLKSETLLVERRNEKGEIIEENGKPLMGFVDNNVHTMWDDALIDHQMTQLKIVDPNKFNERDVMGIFRAFSKQLASQTRSRDKELRALMYEDVLRWVELANQHRPLAYDPAGVENTDAYYKARIGIINDLLQRAAYHLAGVLNSTFDPKNNQPDERTAEFNRVRRLELDARIKAGRQTEFRTVCDDLAD